MIAGVKQSVEPCVLHATHSPITIINERHHIYPQHLQRRLWGEVRSHELVSLCATGHNTVHYAINTHLETGVYPREVIGTTRDLAERAVNWYLGEQSEHNTAT